MGHDIHLADTLEHLWRHWESRPGAASVHIGDALPRPQPYTIAFSREAGTDCTSIARFDASRVRQRDVEGIAACSRRNN